MANGGIEFFDVKGNKTVIFFVFNGFKPLDHRCRVALVIFLSRIALLILPISDLVGLISRQVGLSTKSDLSQSYE